MRADGLMGQYFVKLQRRFSWQAQYLVNKNQGSPDDLTTMSRIHDGPVGRVDRRESAENIVGLGRGRVLQGCDCRECAS